MSDLITITNTTTDLEIKNKKLKKATDRIYKIGDTMRKCAYETAFIIAEVAGSKCYEEDGFKSVHEWTEHYFGFKKSTSYTLLKIGREYTSALVGENNRISGYGSNLSLSDEDDFTISQIEKMLPLGHDKAYDMVRSGEIKTDMTCKEIYKIVRDFTADDEPETPEDIVDEPETPEDGVEEGNDVVVLRDLEGNRYDVPYTLFEKIRKCYIVKEG